MKICFPIVKNDGLSSRVNIHFGSSEEFLIYNTDDKSFKIISNKDANHEHGKCQPVKALGAISADIIIVGGLGLRALAGLKEQGVRVLRACEGTVQDNINKFNDNSLEDISEDNACTSHSCS